LFLNLKGRREGVRSPTVREGLRRKVPSLTVGLLTLALCVELLHLDINDLAAKGAQDLLDGGVLGRGLMNLIL
jgi:hypothetical protein